MSTADAITSDAQRDYAKAYYRANKARVLARKKARYEANREEILSQVKAYREANRDRDLARKKAYREANKEAIRITRKRREIKSEYGLTIDQVAAMEKGQKGRCGICKTPFGVKGFHIDHCHATGVVRGLLCAPCNQGLGFFGDNPETLRRAIRYLKAR